MRLSAFSAVQALFTIGEQLGLGTPAGCLGVELLSFMGPTLIAAHAISVGVAALAGEEQHGALEAVLSTPVARARFSASAWSR